VNARRAARLLLAAHCAALLLAPCAPARAQDADRAGGVRSAEDAAPPSPSARERLLEIQRRVQAAARYPEAALRRGLEGEATVQFGIDANGHPEELTTLRSSGSGLLDRAAEQAVRDAAPLPYLIGLLRVPVRFELR
jgi:protein TonB